MYLAQDIPAFVMYCVNGESGSSLLIESTNSMIYRYVHVKNIIGAIHKAATHYRHNVTYALTTLRSAVHTAFAHYVNFTLIKH